MSLMSKSKSSSGGYGTSSREILPDALNSLDVPSHQSGSSPALPSKTLQLLLYPSTTYAMIICAVRVGISVVVGVDCSVVVGVSVVVVVSGVDVVVGDGVEDGVVVDDGVEVSVDDGIGVEDGLKLMEDRFDEELYRAVGLDEVLEEIAELKPVLANAEERGI
ncbi:uncharacterized protein N7498_005458 [Penicillium cinerascens]|uniref:Uncharacterized protein n=1 Tax=Penicillium cinerascens TaxID=70096 RepID=A0A9W9MNL2_9EURO|nr:uncharacterized protein N7498_005458 [Penicillium cinerascens]KAJ5204579.1 hypothetical protein N7498_005458 [Penicillium cinerascens]